MKELRSKIALLIAGISFCSFGQKDSLPYTLFNNNLVIYSDIGYSSAPFSISYPFQPGLKKISYKNNFRTIWGFGLSYKWFSLRFGIPLPGNTRPTELYGETKPINVGFDFSFKKTFWDFDLRIYKGYAIKDAYRWNTSLNLNAPHEILSNAGTFSFSSNSWYFHNKHFKIQALRGKTGHYNKKVQTWYLKGTFNLFGVSNDKNPIISTELIDSGNIKTSATTISSVDFGLIPGFAYVDRINNWQFSGLIGLGGVIQTKYYATSDKTQLFLGLAPRYDIRFIGGYSVPKYFIFIVTDFDNKSIRFMDLVYRQHYYSVKLVVGKRFPEKEKKKKKD